MLISEAADMIRCQLFDPGGQPAVWADLGCGNGVFTQALASLLPAGSVVHAVDQTDALSLELPAAAQVQIVFQQADFEQDTLALPKLDGILMANSLHYVKDKDKLVEKLMAYSRPGAAFLVVEYDTSQAIIPWVPYPVNFSLLSDLFSRHGFGKVQRLAERASVYRRDQLYSALITR